MVETAAPIDEVVAVSVAMLTDLRDKELGLLELILAHLPPPTLVELHSAISHKVTNDVWMDLAGSDPSNRRP